MEENQKSSKLGIIALILSIIGCTFFIGIILGIIDLCRKDNKKKTVSIIAIVIGCVWLLLGLMFGGSNKDIVTENTTEVTTKATTEAVTEVTTEITTEAVTEVTTEATTETITEVATENTTETTTEIATEETSSTDWSKVYDDDEHMAQYVTITQKAVDKYITGVKWPWGFGEYTCVDYSADKPGVIVCMVNSVEIKNVVEKQSIYVIFEINEDGTRYGVHSVAVGNKIYEDDGLLQNLLDKFNQ